MYSGHTGKGAMHAGCWFQEVGTEWLPILQLLTSSCPATWQMLLVVGIESAKKVIQNTYSLQSYLPGKAQGVHFMHQLEAVLTCTGAATCRGHTGCGLVHMLAHATDHDL